MGNEKILINQEKWNLVKKLLMEGKAFREIERAVHVSPNFIIKVKIAEFGQHSVYSEKENIRKNKKISKRTEAIDLFFKGKTPKQGLLQLDIDVNEVKKAQSDYLQLLNLDKISELVQDDENNNLLTEFYKLFLVFKELGINTNEKINEIKGSVESYPDLKKEISNQRKVIYNLTRQNQYYEQVRNEIEYKISTANSSLQTIEYEINNKKIILENLVILEKKKSSCVYNDNFIKKIIESTVKQESWYQTTVLPLMIISVLEVIKNDPMAEAMTIDVYNINNPSILNNVSNKKVFDIEKLISYIFYRYLPIITDINNYSKLLHKNFLQIYSFYLFNILKMSPLKKIDNQENNQNYSVKDYYNNKLFPNFGNELNNNNNN